MGFIRVHVPRTTNYARMTERVQVHNIIINDNTGALFLLLLCYRFYNHIYLVYTWITNSYCPSSYKIQEYGQLSEARDACSSDSSCRSIVDEYCGNQIFFTCSKDILPSVIGSCTWMSKKTGMKRQIRARYNT